ncbi:eukaryotic translation initiation factor 5A [Suillus subalutaceus]|uniref:eukaryotic translation initiation factor 5A n=1 Tax=Suillus subalutaceus TaxID=48586 RepID=UPI001B86398F|nr:eukaryotic translation initiation factor 5A [Suillus subalutaceus]KAG1830970.1 eukaryotic translation initiation factor 5A [Suillus subalutaceus]
MSDDEQHNQQFEQASAGASLTFPMQCSALRKNGHVVIKGRPCKIVEMSTSKTGKHGHAKVHLVGVDIFTDKKMEDISPSTHNMDVPNVTRNEYHLDDVKLPDGKLGDEITSGLETAEVVMVTVTAAMGEEQVTSFKVTNQ